MQPRMAGLLSALVIAMGVCVNLWQPWTAWQARDLHPAVPTKAVIAADPIHRIGDLRSMPALLIFDDHDPTVGSGDYDVWLERHSTSPHPPLQVAEFRWTTVTRCREGGRLRNMYS